MKDLYRCVVDAAGNYKTFVLLDKAGQPQYYQLAAGERLVDASPPAIRPHVGAAGFIRPRWTGSAWAEAATAAETEQWEQANPAPEITAPQPTPEQQQLAALTFKQAQQDATIAQLQQANAALMLQLAQTQAAGRGEIDA
ncbi:MAG: hypothetical protein HFG27_04090 [Provencibacterium sp.]|jgi:hypothetical protein|nr:hypothetical protein [Provencibacterium sp.]